MFTKLAISSPYLLRSSSDKIAVWWAFTQDILSSHSVQIHNILPTNLFLSSPCHQFLNHDPSKVWPPSQTISTILSQYRLILSTGKIFLHPIFQGHAVVELQWYNHLLLGSASILDRTILKQGLEFFLFSQLVIGNYQKRHRCRLRGKRN